MMQVINYNCLTPAVYSRKTWQNIASFYCCLLYLWDAWIFGFTK